MPKLTEREKRRPDFLGGRPVVLADGQEWFLAKPRVRFTCGDDDESGAQTYLDMGDDYQAIIERYHAAGRAEPPDVYEVLSAELQAGRFLLLRNYDLTPAEVRSVLQFALAPEDTEGCRIRDEVTDLMLGINAPKPAAGSADSP